MLLKSKLGANRIECSIQSLRENFLLIKVEDGLLAIVQKVSNMHGKHIEDNLDANEGCVAKEVNFLVDMDIIEEM